MFNYDNLKSGRLIETGRLILDNQNLRLSSMFNRDFLKKVRTECLIETGHLTLKTQKLRSSSIFAAPTA